MLLALVLSDDCNRDCSYCYADQRRGHCMGMDTAVRSIELGRSLSPISLRLGFFGGEPLLQFPLLRQIADHARRQSGPPIGFTLTTSGDLITPEVAAYFGGIDVDVSVSAHDADPGGTRRAVRRLAEFGIQPTIVHVATPDNAGSLVDRIRELNRSGVTSFAISPDFYQPWSGAARARIERCYRELSELYLNKHRRGEELVISQLSPRLNALRSGVPMHQSRCTLGISSLTVAPDGSLFPCDRMAVDSSCSSSCIGTIEDGIDHDKWRRITEQRANVPTPGSACRDSLTCGCTCACVNVRLTGSADSVPEVVQWHENMAGAIARELLPRLTDRKPPKRIRRNLIHITAGILAAGSFATSCSDDSGPSAEQAEAPGLSATEGAEYVGEFTLGEHWDQDAIKDMQGESGFVEVSFRLIMSGDDTYKHLLLNENEIKRCLERQIAKRTYARMTLPEEEEELGNALIEEVGEILGSDSRVVGVTLSIISQGEVEANLEQLKTLGVMGY